MSQPSCTDIVPHYLGPTIYHTHRAMPVPYKKPDEPLLKESLHLNYAHLLPHPYSLSTQTQQISNSDESINESTLNDQSTQNQSQFTPQKHKLHKPMSKTEHRYIRNQAEDQYDCEECNIGDDSIILQNSKIILRQSEKLKFSKEATCELAVQTSNANFTFKEKNEKVISHPLLSMTIKCGVSKYVEPQISIKPTQESNNLYESPQITYSESKVSDKYMKKILKKRNTSAKRIETLNSARNRLKSGLKIKITHVDMLSLNRKHYAQLPEVKNKISELERKEQLLRRIKAASEYDQQRRKSKDNKNKHTQL